MKKLIALLVAVITGPWPMLLLTGFGLVFFVATTLHWAYSQPPSAPLAPASLEKPQS